MTAVMQRMSSFAAHPFVRWFLKPRRLPLYYAVIILTGIFYHYAPSVTWLWLILALAVESALFKLFDFVKKHPFLGGIAYLGTGFLFMVLALWMMSAGYDGALFSPDGRENQIYFYVWFMTPQSVLKAEYIGYTIALFLFFSFFIGSIAYYFTFVRYRVLMSFMVMMFPFAIYAKENEVMPVPFIIILFAGYFAVMIYCRQASAEDTAVTAPYQPGNVPELHEPGKKSPYYGKRPEILDSGFLKAAGLFVAAASIAVLVVPKPTVNADRQFLDTLLDMSTLSDFLMNAISGFNEKNDGGDYAQLPFNRALYYTKADEPLNLRMETYTNYSYATDEWSVTNYDGKPERTDYRYRYVYNNTISAVTPEPLPTDLYNTIYTAMQEHPDLAAKYGLTGLAPVNAAPYQKELQVEAASYNFAVYPSPLWTYSAAGSANRQVYRNESGVIFRYGDQRQFRERFWEQYISPQFAEEPSVQNLIGTLSSSDYSDLLMDLQSLYPADQTIADAVESCLNAQLYAASVQSRTPDDVYALAEQLTAGLHSDYEKAMKIRNYLKLGQFTYSLEFPLTDADNVQTFLFKNKTGVCWQFASAMAELCRAAGLTVRFVTGYSMSEEYDRLTGDWDYMITTEHGHAFTDVFIPGYGWMMMDATAGSAETSRAAEQTDVIGTLQYSGLILFGAAVLIVLIVVWLVPFTAERIFRANYKKRRNAQAVQDAFARLRKQWKADPAVTARVLCAEMGEFLQTDLTPLAEGVEETVYANRCTAETADRVYDAYLRAYRAWKPAQRRKRKADRAAAKAARRAETVKGSA